MSEDRIRELEEKIRVAREEYYNLSPVLSDQEFDALVDELHRLKPESPEVTAIGAPIPQLSVWEKVAHQIPMGSLNKVNSEAEFDEWATKATTQVRETHLLGREQLVDFFITHKIDGSSMELVYERGHLVRCVTRGDGIIGEDVTTNIIQVPNIPHILTRSGDRTIRGEIVMLKSVFQEHYASEYANPRNTAAAKVREKKKGGIDCKNLHFIAYWIDSPTVRWDSIYQMFGELQETGFMIPSQPMASDANGIKELFRAETAKRDQVPYEIDGMVVSINNCQVLKELGDLNMRPRGQVAWKFDAAMCVTRVVDVRWQNGPTGRITPVANVEPVNVGGVTITSISLHNLSLFRDLKLFKGCQVLVSRRNDVIPYIEKNLDIEVV